MGPPLSALDRYKFVVLRPYHGCLIASCLVFFLSRIGSIATTQFCLVLLFIEAKAPHSCLPLMRNDVGLLGFTPPPPSYLFLSLWAFQRLIICCWFMLGLPVGPFSFPFLLWAHLRNVPFSLEDGHLFMVGSSIRPMGWCVPLFALYGYAFSLGFYRLNVPAIIS